ncbi:MAG: hypothetical protein ACYDA5_01755 [Vulcanimicrobiaceae bacterium]
MTEILRGQYEDKRIVVWEGTLDDALRTKVQKRSKRFVATILLPDIWEDAAMRESIRKLLDAGARSLSFVGARSADAEDMADTIIVQENRETDDDVILTMANSGDDIDGRLILGLTMHDERKSIYFIPDDDKRLKYVVRYIRSRLDRIDYDARPVRKRAPRAE